MKIAFVSTFYPFRGGIAQFNAALYEALKENHNVKAFNFSLQYPRLLFPGKTQYVSESDSAVKIDSDRVLNSVNPVSYRKTAKKIKAFNPDLIIIGYWMPFMAPSLGYIVNHFSNKTKLVAIVHNAIPHEQSKLDHVLNKYFFKKINKVITLSYQVKLDIHRKYPNIDIKTLLHPVYEHFGSIIDRNEALNRLGLKPDKKYLLFFGLIRPYKGLDLAIKALKNTPENTQLIIAGESYEAFSKYEKMIQENALNHRVHCFQRYIPDEEVKYFFSAADACILPYKSATQSGVVAVAFHFNLPVISTNVGGLSEFVKQGENGYLIEKPNANLLASKINEVFKDDKLEKMKGNLVDSNNQHNWQDFAEKLLSFAMD